MISQLDIYPTICELLNLERPGWLTGKSMMPVIRGDAKEINDQVFGEVTYHAAYEPKRAIRTHRYKYIRHFGGRTTPVLPNCDDGPSKSLWLSYDWKNQPVVEERLYDLVFDPLEHNNLATDRTAGVDPGRHARPPGHLDEVHRRPAAQRSGTAASGCGNQRC